MTEPVRECSKTVLAMGGEDASTFRPLTIRGRPRIGTGRRQPSRLETRTQLESDGQVAAVKRVTTWRPSRPRYRPAVGAGRSEHTRTGRVI